MWLYHRLTSPNDANRMANSVDPDQTAPLGLHCLPRHICPKTLDHYGIPFMVFMPYVFNAFFLLWHEKIIVMTLILLLIKLHNISKLLN